MSTCILNLYLNCALPFTNIERGRPRPHFLTVTVVIEEDTLLLQATPSTDGDIFNKFYRLLFPMRTI